MSGGASLKNGEQLCLSRCHCLSTNERETNESTNERNRFEFDSEVKSQQLDSRTVRARIFGLRAFARSEPKARASRPTNFLSLLGVDYYALP